MMQVGIGSQLMRGQVNGMGGPVRIKRAATIGEVAIKGFSEPLGRPVRDGPERSDDMLEPGDLAGCSQMQRLIKHHAVNALGRPARGEVRQPGVREIQPGELLDIERMLQVVTEDHSACCRIGCL